MAQKYVAYAPCDPHAVILVDGTPENVVKKVIPYQNLEAPVHKGDIIGAVQYSYDGDLIDEVHIYADEDVEKMTMLYSLKQVSGKLFMAK